MSSVRKAMLAGVALVAVATVIPFASSAALAQAAAPPALSYVDDLVAQADAILAATGADRKIPTAVRLLKEAANTGSTIAMQRLAHILVLGDGVPADPVQAEALLVQAVTAGDIGANEALGDLYRADTPLKDVGKAAEAYQRAIDAGSTATMRKLATILLRGDGVPADPARAEALVRQAIAAGDVQGGQEALGDLYRAETPLKNVAKAVEAYQRAADAGNTVAARTLAGILWRGEGVPAKPARAEKLLLQAADAGDTAWANEALGDLYRAETPLKDLAKAAEAYQRAVDVGNIGAAGKLATMLATGEGIAADPARAEALITRAIEAGDIGYAPEVLGDLYLYSMEPKRPADAAAAFKQAADAGNTSAMRKLAGLLTRGEGVRADPPRAEALLRQAIAAGDIAWGEEALGDFYFADTPLKNVARGIEAYQKAADAKNANAMRRLADIYVRGDGIPADPARGAELLRQAVATGDVVYGQEALGDLYRDNATLKDIAKAADAYRLAADAGNTSAMRKLAEILWKGDGIQADPSAAEALLKKALATGDVIWSQEALGDFYRAETPLKNPGKVVAAYQAAVDAGNPWAMQKLALMLERGDGVTADLKRAEALLRQAMDADERKFAPKQLGDLLLAGTPTPEARSEAFRMYVAASEQGNADAHLAAAALLRSEPTSAAARQGMVLHLKAAAKIVEPEQVALAMMRYPKDALLVGVQQMLRDAGYGRRTDGVFGPQMEASIAKFCAAQALEDCPADLVTTRLLVALLKYSS